MPIRFGDPAQVIPSTRGSLSAADNTVVNTAFTRNDSPAELYAGEELPNARTSSETRPKNAYVNYIIKY
jgi:hypothetical protein